MWRGYELTFERFEYRYFFRYSISFRFGDTIIKWNKFCIYAMRCIPKKRMTTAICHLSYFVKLSKWKRWYNINSGNLFIFFFFFWKMSTFIFFATLSFPKLGVNINQYDGSFILHQTRKWYTLHTIATLAQQMPMQNSLN